MRNFKLLVFGLTILVGVMVIVAKIDKENSPAMNNQTQPSEVVTNTPPIVTPTSTRVHVFFSNSKLDPEVSCNKVFPVERNIPVGQNEMENAIKELLKGPTPDEVTKGYFSSMNNGVELNMLTLENGVVVADFSSELDEQVGGSCRVIAIRSSITETLKQFPSVTQVVIAIDGQTEDILQP